MVAFLQHVDDFMPDEKSSPTPAYIALLYAQIRHKFPGKNFPEDPTLDQMEAVVRGFRVGTQIVHRSGTLGP
jgi:hypothetical protein